MTGKDFEEAKRFRCMPAKDRVENALEVIRFAEQNTPLAHRANTIRRQAEHQRVLLAGMSPGNAVW